MEVKEYRAWAEGEVYGVIVEKSVTWTTGDAEADMPDEMVTWEYVGSVWGHIGREYAESAAREEFAPYAKENRA